MLRSDFDHVSRASSLQELSAEIQRAEINLAFTNLLTTDEEQSYVDGLNLEPNGDFEHIPFLEQGPNISRSKEIAVINAGSLAELGEDKIGNQMFNLPNRPGKEAFTKSISNALKTFWVAQNGELPITAMLMLKDPTEKPRLHFDGMAGGPKIRGVATIKGEGMGYVEDSTALAQLGGSYAENRVMSSVDELPAGTKVGTVPTGALSFHRVFSLTENTGPNAATVPYVPNLPEATHPLAHVEASAKQCGGKPRLQLMINQVPIAP